MHKRSALAGALVLALTIVSGAALAGGSSTSPQARADGEDWPQWRGPDGRAIADGAELPTTWSATENVAWKAELRGLGVSSPIVSGERVFVTYQVGRGVRREGSHPTLARDPDIDPSLERPLGNAMTGTPDSQVTFVVAAFHRADGRPLWEHELRARGLQPVHDKGNMASPSPVTDGEHVYAWFGTGQIVALDFEGELLWQRHLGEEISPFVVQWGHASSPTLYGDSLILQCDHNPAAYLLWLDKHSGEEQRRVDRGRDMNSHSTPSIVPGPTGDELIVNSSGRLDSYNPTTGDHLWHAGEPNSYPIGVPTYEAGVLYTSRGYRSGPYMALRLAGC